MLFPLSIQDAHGQQTSIPVNLGETLFVLGANGTGKSSLMHRFSTQAQGSARRISASRQTWLQSSTLEFAPAQKIQYETQARNWEITTQSRFSEQNAPIKSSLTLYDLIDAENVDSRAIALAMRAGRVDEAQMLAAKAAPISSINEILALSNIPVTISVFGGDKLMASKNGSELYGIAELSDGERNALLIAADVLTSKAGTLLIIDEPERHLHRSIISPLLSHLFRARQDCGFVVATHDLMLPVDNPEARVLLVRACTYSGQVVQSWDFDLIPANSDIDEVLKQDIVGARRRILFIEGDESSLDKPLYAILFPNISIRAKGPSHNVINAVRGIASSDTIHWVMARGIVDSDGRDSGSVTALHSEGIFALPFYSVESIYYHPDIIRGVAERFSPAYGMDYNLTTKTAIEVAINAVQAHLPRLATRTVEKNVRKALFSLLPTSKSIAERIPIRTEIRTADMMDAEIELLKTAVATKDWTCILARCPVRDTPALDAIARTLGFISKHFYENAVLKLLREDASYLAKARSFFDPLPIELEVA